MYLSEPPTPFIACEMSIKKISGQEDAITQRQVTNNDMNIENASLEVGLS